MTIGEVLGILGFALSLGLAGIRLWETFWQKSRFQTYMEWAGTGDDLTLELSIANVGWKKDSVRTVNFRTPYPRKPDPHNREWLEWEIVGPTWTKLPAVLDVDEMTGIMRLPLPVLRNAGLDQLVQALARGEAQLIVVNARDKNTHFSIPRPGQGPPIPSLEEIRPV